MEYQTLSAVSLRQLVLTWQQMRAEGWELDTSVKHMFNWKKFRFEYTLKIFRFAVAEDNVNEQVFQ
jgi:hypothetical protein